MITESGCHICMTETHEMHEQIWLSRKQVAGRWNLPEKTLAEWATNRTGPPYGRFGRHVRYRLSDVVAWEERQIVRD